MGGLHCHHRGMRRTAMALSALLLSACPASEASKIRLGVETSLREVGLGPWLEASFSARTGVPVQVRYLDAEVMPAAVARGELDEVIFVSETLERALRKEGALRRTLALGHEELILVGPSKNLLGKYAHTRGSDLLRNVARTNYRFLEGRPGSVEGTRHAALYAETNDLIKPGSWFSTKLEGRALYEAAVRRKAFAWVRRSSMLLAAKDGLFPERIWGESDPALVIVVRAGEVAPSLARGEGRLHDWLETSGAEAVAGLGRDTLGHSLYAPGAPEDGQGASTAPLEAWLDARRPKAVP